MILGESPTDLFWDAVIFIVIAFGWWHINRESKDENRTQRKN